MSLIKNAFLNAVQKVVFLLRLTLVQIFTVYLCYITSNITWGYVFILLLFWKIFPIPSCPCVFILCFWPQKTTSNLTCWNIAREIFMAQHFSIVVKALMKGTLSSWPGCINCCWEAVRLSGHVISGCQLHYCLSEQGVDKCLLCILSKTIKCLWIYSCQIALWIRFMISTHLFASKYFWNIWLDGWQTKDFRQVLLRMNFIMFLLCGEMQI